MVSCMASSEISQYRAKMDMRKLRTCAQRRYSHRSLKCFGELRIRWVGWKNLQNNYTPAKYEVRYERYTHLRRNVVIQGEHGRLRKYVNCGLNSQSFDS